MEERTRGSGPGKAERSRSMEDVARYIKRMKFRKRLFGGVDEADVWRQLEALHKEYEAVFTRQELKYETLLEEAYGGSTDPPGGEDPDG